MKNFLFFLFTGFVSVIMNAQDYYEVKETVNTKTTIVTGSDTARELMISRFVGSTIEPEEKLKYSLFPNISNKKFKQAKFLLNPYTKKIYLVYYDHSNQSFSEEYDLNKYLNTKEQIGLRLNKNDSLLTGNAKHSNGKQLLIVNESVGERIDSLEKKIFNLFNTYSNNGFVSAIFYLENKKIICEIVQKNKEVIKEEFSQDRYWMMCRYIAEQNKGIVKGYAKKPYAVLTLNNATSYNGRVVEEYEDAVVFETFWDVIQINKNDIKEIH